MKKLAMRGCLPTTIAVLVLATAVLHPRFAGAQYILAGEVTSQGYFVDIEPDTTIIGPNNHNTNFPPAVYKFDIDGDQSYDMFISSIGNFALGGGGFRISIHSLKPGEYQIAGRTDTCHPYPGYSYPVKLANCYGYHDTIGHNLPWSNDSVHNLHYSGWTLMGGCEFNAFPHDTLGCYIAVRHVTPADSGRFGWIRVDYVQFPAITIYAYGFSRNSTGLEDLSFQTRFFPVPAGEHVTMIPPWNEGEMTIWDMQGRRVYRAPITHGPMLLSLDGWHSGIYLVRFTQAGENVVAKLIHW